MPKLPCPKCCNDGIFETIGRFLFFRCPFCGYSIIAKHYRAKLAEEAKNKNNPALFKDKYGVIRTLTSDDIPF